LATVISLVKLFQQYLPKLAYPITAGLFVISGQVITARLLFESNISINQWLGTTLIQVDAIVLTKHAWLHSLNMKFYMQLFVVSIDSCVMSLVFMNLPTITIA
jgi:hypothetical protein